MNLTGLQFKTMSPDEECDLGDECLNAGVNILPH